MTGYKTRHSETALTINDTHQFLKYYEQDSRFEHLAAFAPTQNWEKVSGYDVEIPFLKTVVYQYKRPKIAGGKRPSVANRQFELDVEQWLTLVLLFDPGEAFFALPVCWDDDEIPEAADRALFVDVHGILPNTSRTYVPPDSVTDGQIGTWVRAKINRGNRYLIHPKYIYGWQRHRDDITGCKLGLRVWDLGDEALEEYFTFRNDEEPPRFSPPKTPEFQDFQERIESLSGNGASPSKRRTWARRRLWRVLKRQQYEYEWFYRFLALVETKAEPDSVNRLQAWRYYLLVADTVDIDSMLGAWWILTEISHYKPPEDAVGENPASVDSAVNHIKSCIDRETAFDALESVLDTFEDENVDPTRFRVGNSRHLMFGGDSP